LETEMAWAKVGGDERGREGESLERVQRKGIKMRGEGGRLGDLNEQCDGAVAQISS
jgi:hypothetical protein